MSKRVVITKELARKIKDQPFNDTHTFNPFLDEDMNICITQEEIDLIEKEEFMFLKQLTLKDKSEILKDFKTEKEWVEYYKQQADEESARLAVEIEKVKKK